MEEWDEFGESSGKGFMKEVPKMGMRMGYIAETGQLFTKFVFFLGTQTTFLSLHTVKHGHLPEFWPMGCG